MKPVKEFTPEEVRDFVLLCLRTQWASLGYANTMERDLNAAIAKQKQEREAKGRADLPFPLGEKTEIAALLASAKGI